MRWRSWGGVRVELVRTWMGQGGGGGEVARGEKDRGEVGRWGGERRMAKIAAA